MSTNDNGNDAIAMPTIIDGDNDGDGGNENAGKKIKEMTTIAVTTK